MGVGSIAVFSFALIYPLHGETFAKAMGTTIFPKLKQIELVYLPCPKCIRFLYLIVNVPNCSECTCVNFPSM